MSWQGSAWSGGGRRGLRGAEEEAKRRRKERRGAAQGDGMATDDTQDEREGDEGLAMEAEEVEGGVGEAR